MGIIENSQLLARRGKTNEEFLYVCPVIISFLLCLRSGEGTSRPIDLN